MRLNISSAPAELDALKRKKLRDREIEREALRQEDEEHPGLPELDREIADLRERENNV